MFEPLKFDYTSNLSDWVYNNYFTCFFLQEMAADYPDILFFKVDVDENEVSNFSGNICHTVPDSPYQHLDAE